MKKLLFGLFLLAIGQSASAQYSEFRNNEQPPNNINLTGNNATLTISGRVSAFYKYRMMTAGNINLKNNGFFFKDADLDFLGRSSGFVYEMHLSPLDLITSAAMGNTSNAAGLNGNASPNPYAPGVKAMYVSYEGTRLPFSVKLGYDKIAFSQGSLNDAYNSPFWSHANLYGGDLFSRRDLGVTVYQSFWKKRIRAYAGIYTGLGENVFEYGNDGSGRQEYAARVDVSYPAPTKYVTVDNHNSPIPQFRVGINGRYTDKTQPTGRSLTTDVPDAMGPYGIRMVNGKKVVYGADFMFRYRSFTLFAEADYVNAQPTDPTDALYMNTLSSFNGGKVNAGGYCITANYNWKKAHSVFAAEYENVNGNDLISGKQEWMRFAYALTLNGFNSVIKAEFYHPLTEDAAQNPLKYSDQFRVGYQLVF